MSAGLPAGFVLDGAPAPAQAPQPDAGGLPAGFVLDAGPAPAQAAPAPQAQPSRGFTLPSFSSVLNGVMNGATESMTGGDRSLTLSGIVKNVAEGAASAATLPRDVYQGKVDLGSEEAIKRSVDFAGFAAGGTPAARSALSRPAAPATPVVQAADEFGVVLTAGQRTGDSALQSAENAMLGGAKGPGAQRVAQEAATQQQGQILAARDAIGETAGRGMVDLNRAADAGGAVAEGVRAAATTAREGFKDAYGRAFSGEGEFAPEALKGIGTRITEGITARAEPLIIDPVLTPAATRALSELDNISNLRLGVNGQPGAGEEVVGVSLRGVDQARRKLVAYYKAAKTNPADARAVSGIINEFDGQIEQAVANGLFNGSDETLTALREARAAYASYQRTFKPQGAGDDVGNAIRNIVERDATPEQVANYLYGSTKIGATGTSVRMADRMKSLLGEESAEWSAIRQGAWQRLTGVAEGRTEMGAQKMSERILEFLNGDGKSLATRLFTAEEAAEMRKFANVLKAIAAKPGTTNPSNSGNRAAALARDSFAAIASMLGAASSGPVGAGAGYAAGRAVTAGGDALASRRARQLFAGQEPISIGRRLAEAQPQRLAISPRVTLPALQGQIRADR